MSASTAFKIDKKTSCYAGEKSVTAKTVCFVTIVLFDRKKRNVTCEEATRRQS